MGCDLNKEVKKTMSGRLLIYLSLLIMISLCLVSSYSFAEPQNGVWWKKAPTSFKVGYIAGYFAGRNEESRKWAPIAEDMSEQIKEEEKDRYKEMIKPMKREEEYLSNMSFGAFAEKVDSFYSDNDNLVIPVLQAFSMVRREMGGEDKNLLECERIYIRIAHSRGLAQEDRLRDLEEKLQECASLGQKVHPDTDKEDEYIGTEGDAGGGEKPDQGGKSDPSP